MEKINLYCGDCLEVLKNIESDSIQCCITSPPYYGLRDYGTAKWEGGDIDCNHKNGALQSNKTTLHPGTNQNDKRNFDGMPYKNICGKCGAVRIDHQLGLEKSPEEYVENLVKIFQEVKRALKETGTLWLNLGDSYAGSGGPGSQYDTKATSGYKGKFKKYDNPNKKVIGVKPKDLIGIPWMVAFALRSDGWYLRNDVIWAKNNAMPESVKDRFTRSHEYLFLLSKNKKYYFDQQAILEPAAYDGRKDTRFKGSEKYKNSTQTFASQGHERWPKRLNPENNSNSKNDYKHSGYFKENGDPLYSIDSNGLPARNKRDVWFINTKPYKGAHFATFPPALVEPCILAGSKEGDMVLDPFCGSGTVGEVAQKYNRNFMGIDLNPDYIELTKKRLGII